MKAVTVQEVSREMGVRYVLEGRARKADGQMRIIAQLIDATTGEQVWSERYERPVKEIFALQDEIVQRIVTTLKLQITLREQEHLVRKHTGNLEAYDYLMRGWEYFYRSTKEANTQARQMFEKATALDPQYAEAHAWLGYTYLIVWLHQWDPNPQNLQQAFEVVQKALALDEALPRAHRILSWVYMSQMKYEPAVTAAERAIALDPNDAESYGALVAVFNFFGERSTEALELIEKTIRLNPHHSFSPSYHLGWAYNLVGRYEEAIAAQKQAVLRNPNWLLVHGELFLNYRSLWSSQLSQDSQTLDQGLKAAQQMSAVYVFRDIGATIYPSGLCRVQVRPVWICSGLSSSFTQSPLNIFRHSFGSVFTSSRKKENNHHSERPWRRSANVGKERCRGRWPTSK